MWSKEAEWVDAATAWVRYGVAIGVEIRFDRFPVVADAVSALKPVLADEMALLRRKEAWIAAPTRSPDRRRFIVPAVGAFPSTHRPPAPRVALWLTTGILHGSTAVACVPGRILDAVAVEGPSQEAAPYDDTVWTGV